MNRKAEFVQVFILFIFTERRKKMNTLSIQIDKNPAKLLIYLKNYPLLR